MKEKDGAQPAVKAGECGAIHGDCPDTWKGTCERPAGHEGSHYCGKCSSYF